MTLKALIIVANGSEEMEIVIPADVLRRAGFEVLIASIEKGDHVNCSRNIRIVPDAHLEDVFSQQFDIVMLPGGLPGADTLAQNIAVGQILKAQESRNGWVAAICAAPIALKAHDIYVAHKLTSHPSKAAEFGPGSGYTYSEDRVVVDRKLITSRGPGTAFEFALAIVEKLISLETANKVKMPMLV